MAGLDIKTMARFPFLNEASDYIKGLDLSLESLIDSFVYSSAWTRGQERLVEAIEYGEIQDPGTTTEAENINELLSYVIARIVVSCISEMYLVRRYALAEAVYAYHELQIRDTRFVAYVATQFGLKPEAVKDSDLELKIVDYLKSSTQLRAPEYKLVNRDVKSGLVTISKRELARLVQESLRLKIQNDLPVDVDEKLKKKILPKINEIISLVQNKKQKYETHDLGKVSIIRFPPCMKQLLGMTQAGENVPHVGRFALASFLHNIGLSSENILSTFSTSPDFDVEKARYQVEHITGKTSGTKYTPPSCNTMKSNSVCFNSDRLCKKDWLNHPLTYYKVKGKKKSNGKKSIKQANVSEEK